MKNEIAVAVGGSGGWSNTHVHIYMYINTCTRMCTKRVYPYRYHRISFPILVRLSVTLNIMADFQNSYYLHEILFGRSSRFALPTQMHMLLSSSDSHVQRTTKTCSHESPGILFLLRPNATYSHDRNELEVSIFYV